MATNPDKNPLDVTPAEPESDNRLAPAQPESPPNDTDPGLSSTLTADRPLAADDHAVTDAPAACDPDALAQQLANVSHKATANLMSLRSKIQELETAQAGPAQEAAVRLHGALTEKLNKNHAYQEQLKAATIELIATVKDALESGQSQAALSAWDRIQGNISGTSGRTRKELLALVRPFKADILKLRDWKLFAATEKKKELIQQMQALKESDLSPPEISRRVGAIRKQWQALGRSQHNDGLWRRFKKAADEAYEPCKAWLKERKKHMAENLQKRLELCDDLEATLKTLVDGDIDVGKISNLLKQSDKTWKQHAPVEPNRVKSIQKRYYGLVDQFRKLRKSSIRANAASKKALIDKAVELSQLEDNRAAMQSAKTLQKDWQEIGPTTFKEDRLLWNEFRAACDKIFGERRKRIEQTKKKLSEAEEHLNKLLGELESLLTLEEEDFRQSRARYQNLLQEFSASLDPRLRHSRSGLIERCNDIKRRYQARHQTLPDKKQLALRKIVDERTESLQKLEDCLLACTDESAYQSILKEFEESHKDDPGCSDSELERLLNHRWAILRSVSSAHALRDAGREAALSLRDLCIDMEIRADSSSPQEDQSRRMELQLRRLEQGLGQNNPERREMLRYAQESELRARCIGPLSSELRKPFLARIRTATECLR